MMLWDFIKSKMLQAPSQTVCEEGAEMSFEELIVYAKIFSKHLQGEKCCAILCGSEMMTAIALLSCFAAEVTAVPLSVRYGALYCNSILDTLEPTAVITDANGQLQVMHITQSAYQEPDIHPALIMFTSGTTGTPKGAMLTEENIITNVNDICDYFRIGSDDSILIARPLYHCAVLTGEFLTSLVKGTKIRFYSQTFNPKILFDLITEYGITVFCSTPTLMSLLARFKRKNTSSPLRTICVSGECMSKETGKRIADAFPDAKIYHVYGLTEACPRVSYLPPQLYAAHTDSVGIPLKSVSIKIVRTDGTSAKKNEEGILWVKGNNIMTGYYNKPQQTKKVLKDGWLCTGDIAVLDSEGLLKIKGRSDDLIIRAGMNIYPQEIESALKIDPRTNDVLVYKINHPDAGVQIGLKISGDFTNVEEVKQLCTESLPSFQVPSVIQLLDDLPKNSSGKIIRTEQSHVGA